MNARTNGIRLTLIVVAGAALTAVVGAAARGIPIRNLMPSSETGSSCCCGPL